MSEHLMPIGDLKKLELHDQDLDSFAFDSLSKRISMVISIYNEEESDYDNLEIIFTEVENLNPNDFLIENLPVEIYTLDVSEQSGKHLANFMLLLGFGKPSIELSFRFESVIKKENERR